MSVIMNDINNRVGHQLKRGQLKGFPFSDILYAGDTLLICSNAKTTNMYLKQMIIESDKYNMKLNNDKCESLVFNAASKVKFPDGTDMKCVNNATRGHNSELKRQRSADRHTKQNTTSMHNGKGTLPILQESYMLDSMEDSSLQCNYKGTTNVWAGNFGA